MLHRFQLVGVPLAPRSTSTARFYVHECSRRRARRQRRRRLHAAVLARTWRLRRR
jgi:hypothetical protein